MVPTEVSHVIFRNALTMYNKNGDFSFWDNMNCYGSRTFTSKYIGLNFKACVFSVILMLVDIRDYFYIFLNSNI